MTLPGTEKKSSSWITFRLAERRAASIGLVFSDVLRLRPGQAVGIMAANSAEWQLVHLAASSRRLVVVPLYATLSAAAVTQIVDHAEIVALFVGARQLPTVAAVAAACGTLQHTVVIDSDNPDLCADGVQTLSSLLDCCEGPNSFSIAAAAVGGAVAQGVLVGDVWRPPQLPRRRRAPAAVARLSSRPRVGAVRVGHGGADIPAGGAAGRGRVGHGHVDAQRGAGAP